MGSIKYTLSTFSDKECKTASKTDDMLCKTYATMCTNAKDANPSCTAKDCTFTYTYASSATTAQCEQAKKALKDAGTKVDGECTANTGFFYTYKWDCGSSGVGKNMVSAATAFIMVATVLKNMF